MPEEASEQRGDQKGLLRRLTHEAITSNEVWISLEYLTNPSVFDSQDLSEDDRLVVKRLYIDAERGRKLPGEFVQEWNRRMQDYFGITPEKDSEGVLQDIHWSMGYMGYFGTYTIGNLYSAQIFEAMSEAIPDLDKKIANADFEEINSWLKENIHQHCSTMPAEDIIRNATGSGLDMGPFVEYLRDKFTDIYEIHAEG